ncbi:MAG: DsbA family oxidoreductase [Candidatus Limnocylindrales bacterium]
MNDGARPVSIVVYSDYVCPWCYVGQAVVERIRAERETVVDWRPFFLRPDTPPEGMRLSAEMRARMGSAHERLRTMAADAGLDMVFPDIIPNTRRALEATEYARVHGRLESFHRAVAQRYYGEGLDIHDWAVLRSAAIEAGLDSAEMQRQTDAGAFRSAVDRSIAEARALGVTGVPTYVLDGRYAIVGAQPIEAFHEVLDLIDAGMPEPAQVESASGSG